MNSQQLDFIDLLNIMALVVGVANYSENISQEQLQENLNEVVSDIHRHLEQQDAKLSRILDLLAERGDSHAENGHQ